MARLIWIPVLIILGIVIGGRLYRILSYGIGEGPTLNILVILVVVLGVYRLVKFITLKRRAQ